MLNFTMLFSCQHVGEIPWKGFRTFLNFYDVTQFESPSRQLSITSLLGLEVGVLDHGKDDCFHLSALRMLQLSWSRDYKVNWGLVVSVRLWKTKLGRVRESWMMSAQYFLASRCDFGLEFQNNCLWKSCTFSADKYLTTSCKGLLHFENFVSLRNQF